MAKYIYMLTLISNNWLYQFYQYMLWKNVKWNVLLFFEVGKTYYLWRSSREQVHSKKRINYKKNVNMYFAAWMEYIYLKK